MTIATRASAREDADALPVATICDLWNAGHDTAQIASILGLRESQVYNVLARLSK